jgi:hypothetical protein
MGWLSSVGIAQHLHRRLMLTSPSSGAGLPTDQELRKDKELPVCVGTPGGEHLWQVYLDNFDELRAVAASEAQRVEGTPSPWQQRVREAYQTWDLPRNVKKCEEQQSKVCSLGAEVDGSSGLIRPRRSKLVDYIGGIFHLWKQKKARLKHWQIGMGHLVYIAQFRRPLMCIYDRVWRHMSPWYGIERETPAQVREELILGLCLLPLARMNLKTPFCDIVSCSDASLNGAGVCVSTRVTEEGREALHKMTAPTMDGGEFLLVIGMFDGIAGLRRGLQLLGVAPKAYITVENNDKSVKVVKQFPQRP